MAKSYCNLLYHIVFSTKERYPWLSSELAPRVHQYLGGGVKGEGGVPLLINGTPDHVHLLCKLRQDKAMSNAVRSIKSNSSGWVHDTFPGLRAFRWQAGYGAFTVSQSQVAKVQHYIEGQEGHHRRVPFKEELLALLRKHEIEYDERNLWD